MRCIKSGVLDAADKRTDGTDAARDRGRPLLTETVSSRPGHDRSRSRPPLGPFRARFNAHVNVAAHRFRDRALSVTGRVALATARARAVAICGAAVDAESSAGNEVVKVW